jgi:hypothetical protein
VMLLFVFALTVSVATADVLSTSYYIGNFTAFGKFSNFVPYPLGLCVLTGASTTSYDFAIFTCNDGNITQQTYAAGDSTCSGSSTSATWVAGTTPGEGNYASCSGTDSYMVLGEYLGSCSAWKLGSNPLVTTTISMNACTYQKTVSDVKVYSISTCDGDGYTTTLYANDYTCSVSAAKIQFNYTANGCGFYLKEEVEGSTESIYTALLKCVKNDVTQRCTAPLALYTFNVTAQNLQTTPNFTKVYKELFEYATVEVQQKTSNSAWLDLDFCTEWEDKKYITSLENLGSTTLKSLDVTATSSVCWSCTSFNCTEVSLCASDDYCSSSVTCATEATTTTKSPKKSASVTSVSVASLAMLVLSFIF